MFHNPFIEICSAPGCCYYYYIKKMTSTNYCGKRKTEIFTIFDHDSDIRINSRPKVDGMGLESSNEDEARKPKSCCGCRKMSFNPLKRFHQWLNRLFLTLGKFVAENYSYFILFPVFFTLLGMTGLQSIHEEENPEKLFYPATGRAPFERQVIEDNFPINYTNGFIPYHMTQGNGFARILIRDKYEGTIFTEAAFREIEALDSAIRSQVSSYKKRNFTYEDICAKWSDGCYVNRVLNLLPLIQSIENGSRLVNYPIMLYPLILPFDFGGLEVDEDKGVIISAKAVSFSYFLRLNTDEEIAMSSIWEQSFIDAMKSSTFDRISISFFASRSKVDEMRANTDSIRPFGAVAAMFMLIFSVVSVLSFDWVRGKAYLGILGLASAGMATMTAFGALAYLGISFISINKIIPFLMIGIGIDDMFVVLACWRRTHIQDPVVKRLSETYAEAGVSITITSLTNMLSFSVGITTPILGVQIFCIYTTVSILLTYLWHLTFFGACLAIAGRFENDQMHSVICIRVKAKSEAELESRGCYSAFCAGGVSAKDPWNKQDNKPHFLMMIFRDYFGKFLSYPFAKVLISLVFFAYLGGAIYGCTTLEEGLDRKHVVRYDSYAVDFYNVEDTLFRKYPYVIQVVIHGDIDYSDNATEAAILQLHRDFDELPYAADSIFTRSWMIGWYRHLRIYPEVRDNITDEQTFISHLREEHLSGPYNPLALDVKFNEDFTKIVASRFMIYTYNITDTAKETGMVTAFRKIAADSSLNVTVFNPNFILFDQYTMVKPITVEAISIAVAAMVIISLIFLPNPLCSFLVGVAILSIETGVVGYMSLWNVNLDQISMINLIMCIGFSVDFSAHIAYAYLTIKVDNAEMKLRESLYSLGLPIVQGGISTLVCISTFALAPSYVYITFFKIVFLVVLFATLHGLFVIPVLLSVLSPGSKEAKRTLSKTVIKIPRVKLELPYNGNAGNGYHSSSNQKSYSAATSKDRSPSSSSKCQSSLVSSSKSGSRPDPEGCSDFSCPTDSESSSDNKAR